MDYMIWLVAIALLGYVVYAAMTAPPSSGCLSADLARARDEAKRRTARRDTQPNPSALPDAAPAEDLRSVSRRLPEETANTSPTDSSPVAADAPQPSASTAATGDALRNPATGERAAAPTNYRFAKRWIKEAMVAEGLLEKVYANSEIDAELAEQLRSALAAFKSLDKYHA